MGMPSVPARIATCEVGPPAIERDARQARRVDVDELRRGEIAGHQDAARRDHGALFARARQFTQHLALEIGEIRRRAP